MSHKILLGIEQKTFIDNHVSCFWALSRTGSKIQTIECGKV